MELAYKADYCRSVTSRCAFCKSRIPRGALRLAHVFQTPWGAPRRLGRRSYHSRCFFRKHRPKTAADIENFGNLRRQEQEMILHKIRNPPSGAIEDFQIGYSKFDGMICKGCGEKIMKKQIRASRIDYAMGMGRKYNLRQRLWHHLACFVELRSELGFYGSGDTLPGFKTLKGEDRRNVKRRLPGIEQSTIKPKRRAKKEKNDYDPIDRIITEQNSLMLRYREELQKHLNKTELRRLLRENEQEIPVGEARMLDRLADIMTFGRLLPCGECGSGQMVKTNGGYICDGDMTFLHLTGCKKPIETPARREFVVPPKLGEAHPFLKSYKYIPRIRVFKPIEEEDSIGSRQTIKTEETIKVEPIIKVEPLVKIEEVKTEASYEIPAMLFVREDYGLEYDYKVGYALSGRSTCRHCCERIAMHVLRVSHRAMVETYRWYGRSDQWYHFSCFFKQFGVKSVGEFEDFSKLQPDNQKRVLDKVLKSEPLKMEVSEVKIEEEEYSFTI